MKDGETVREAIVVGSGPNGLAAAILLARENWSVTVYEAGETVGGGMRTSELTLPRFRHDVCSAVHPLGAASPVFAAMPLRDFGLEWIQPEYPLAHPFEDGSAAVLSRSVEETAESLGRDGSAWRRLMEPLVSRWDSLVSDLLGPLRLPGHVGTVLRFAKDGLRSATAVALRRFDGGRARGLFAGLAAHSMMPLDQSPTAAFGLLLGASAHAVGWPLARGGSQSIADSLSAYLESLGGHIKTGAEVHHLDDLPLASVVVLDLTPRQILRVAGDRLPYWYRRALRRYRYGFGVFKVDWALREPVPWLSDACRLAGTIHLGPDMGDIVTSEREVSEGRISSRPYVILSQPSLFDPTRAPNNAHTLWGYCHVPNGCDSDMTEAIEHQIERFAPGFRDIILARHTATARALEAYNPNMVGGDLNGGVQNLRQLYTRPVLRLDPYATPLPGLFICSASTPPGGGVHGLCGHYAARSILRRLRGRGNRY